MRQLAFDVMGVKNNVDQIFTFGLPLLGALRSKWYL
jgi:hypothetical protein